MAEVRTRADLAHIPAFIQLHTPEDALFIPVSPAVSGHWDALQCAIDRFNGVLGCLHTLACIDDSCVIDEYFKSSLWAAIGLAEQVDKLARSAAEFKGRDHA